MLPKSRFLGATWCSRVWGHLTHASGTIWHVTVAPCAAGLLVSARIGDLTCGFVLERATGIEPAYPAWESCRRGGHAAWWLHHRARLGPQSTAGDRP